MSDSGRLDRIERELAILRVEFAKLREQVGLPHEPPSAYRAAPPPPPPLQASPAEAAAGAKPSGDTAEQPTLETAVRPTRPRRSFEEILGRYVFVAIATVLVLMGVSAFLSWAIRNGLLTPAARVVLGYVMAAGIAYAGLRLRLRGTREFGNVLLAIALGVAHLVCWFAGPILHVIPSGAALAIGLIASVSLAEFALRHDEEMLCAIGFGGAALAPFVTGDRDGNRIALAIYGLVVVTLGSAALGARPWKYARGVTMWSVILFTAMSGAGSPAHSPPSWLSARLWVLTPTLIALALIPFTHAEHRRSMLRTAAAGLILGGLLRSDQWHADLPSMLITLAGAVILVAALDVTRPAALEREGPAAEMDRQLVDRSTLLDAFLIPVGLFIATVSAAPALDTWQSAAIAAVFAGGAVYLTHRTRGEPESRRFAATAALIALWIVPAALADQALARVAGCVAMGILLLETAHRMNRIAFITGAGGSFLTASIFALESLDRRIPYEYLPFGTVASLCAVIAVVGWVIGVRRITLATFLPELDPKLRSGIREVFITGASLTAFIWGILEFKWAWNRMAGTSLLVVYYAATGALAIYLGRVRKVKHLRIAGLAMSLWAAWLALVRATSLPNVGVRISVYFAVALFLIGIGYWYRRGTEDELEPAPAA